MPIKPKKYIEVDPTVPKPKILLGNKYPNVDPTKPFVKKSIGNKFEDIEPTVPTKPPTDKYWGSSDYTFSPSKRNVRDCVLYNLTTKVAMKCQYNPSDIPRSRSVNYATISSPGMAYPLIQFINGECEDIDINLLFYSEKSPKKLATFEKFVETLLPPKHNKNGFSSPPMFKLYYGKTVETYVLLKKTINSELLNKKGDAYMRSYTLTARRV